jgi:phosphoribosylglycinamide formyltransferase-1
VSRVRTAVLISGRGSNLSALIDAARPADYPAEIALVISNREDAEGLSVAKDAGVPTKIIPHKNYASREEFDATIDAALREANIALVCEAGFMRIHSEWFVKRWEGRLLNIHPSLLPAFPGIRVHQQALDAGVKISGCTVHFIVPELDSGPIVAQAAVPVGLDDTAETLAARILEQEHVLYPRALELLAQGKIMLKDGKCVYSQTPLWTP